MNADTQAQDKYFDSVLYARCYLNEIKIIEVKKKAKPYCAVNASIIDTDTDGKKIYRTIDLIVKGDKAKRLLWKLRDRWPQNRFNHEGDRWIADINIGSPDHVAFQKKDGTTGAVLKGRLINIRNLRIGNEDILGEISEEIPKSILVAPCYVNLINVDKGTAKVSILDGKVGNHTAQNVNLTFNCIEAFTKLNEQGLCPKGYKHRESNAKIFAIVEIEDFQAEGFKTKEGEIKSFLRGKLSTNIRYLKVNDKLLLPKGNATKFVEGFKAGWQAA